MRWEGSPDHSITADLRGVFFRGNQGLPPFLYGVGTWFGPGVDEPTALFILDEEEVTVDSPITADNFPYALGEPQQVAGGPPLIVGRIGDASERVRERIGGFLDTALIIPSGRPEPLAKVGSVLLDPAAGGRGTIGVPVIRTLDDGSLIEGFLTAGHTVAGLGAQVVKSRSWRRSHGRALGRVFVHSDPVAPPGIQARPGFDMAVVDLDPGQKPLTPVSSGLAQLPSSPPQPVPVRMRGGFTRNGLGMVCASLIAGGSPRRQWQDCWIMVPGLAVQGDSGGCVVTVSGQELLGMLVGGARQGGQSRYAMHYVQDHDSAQQSLLTPAGVRLKLCGMILSLTESSAPSPTTTSRDSR